MTWPANSIAHGYHFPDVEGYDCQCKAVDRASVHLLALIISTILMVLVSQPDRWHHSP